VVRASQKGHIHTSFNQSDVIREERMESKPSQDERIMTAIANGSILAGDFGIVAAAIIWLTQREKSDCVRFQALQATAYQFAGMLATILVWACWGSFYAVSLVPLVRDPQAFEDASPPIFWISLTSMILPMALMGLWWLYGLYAGARTLLGHEFQYVWLGPIVKRYAAD
jgi:hypothetical protein